jgi:hypothetical protein
MVEGVVQKNRVILTLFAVICSVESAVISLWLLQIPSDPKNAILFGFSLQRAVALVVIIAGTILFLALAIISWKTTVLSNGVIKLSRSQNAPVITSLVLVLIAITAWFLVFFPPPSHIPRPSSIWERLLPVLLWIGLLSLQSLLLLASLAREQLKAWTIWVVSRAREWADRPVIGYTLVAVSVLIALTQVFYVYYNIGDEGDNFATGWLISNGWSLYKNVFSHHFPFPYLWIAAVIKLFGPSVFVVRFSLILLRTVVLALSMKLSRYHFALGLTALAWSLLGYLYLGNGVLYQSFAGLFAVGAFAIGLGVITGDVRPGKTALLSAGVFLGVSIFSDPLMILPAIIFVGVIAIHSYQNRISVEGLRSSFSHIGFVLAGIIVVAIFVFVYLIFNDSIHDFYQDGILFNAQVYSKYNPRITVSEIIRPVTSFLDAFNKQWRYYLSPHFEWTSFEFIDRWVFLGFFLRVGIFLGSVALLIWRKFLAAILMYLFGAMILVRSETFFHASPFVFMALFCISWLIFTGFKLPDPIPIMSQSVRIQKPFQKIIKTLIVIVWVMVVAAFLWLNLRGAGNLISIRADLGYSANFEAIRGNSGFLREATCRLEAARVLVYPLDPIQYFFAEIPPSSKYHFMTPWVAEVGQQAVLSDIEGGAHLVYVNRDANIWGHPVTDYLREMLSFLDEKYVQIEPNYFASPELLLTCPYNSK